MSAHLRASYSLPKPVLGYHPGTFLERGAAVPFTTPQLNGARARPGSRGGLEFTVPNPSGGRGLYIVPWEGVFALCRPTVHDCRLISALSGLRGVTPTAIRAAARVIAAEGLAGRAARAAAQEAAAADDKARTMNNFQLLLELVGQVEAQEAVPAGSAADLEQRARRAVARIAPGLGRTTEQVATTLEELAGLFAAVGLGRSAPSARVPRVLCALAALRDAMLDWSRAHPDESGGDAARIAESADVTIACARVVVAEVQAMPGAMVPLLRAWAAEPEAVALRATRPDWLVDGWERIILLWQTAEPASRDATLAEMASLIPVMPKEAAEWGRIDIPGITEGGLRRRMVTMAEDWRTGVTIHDLVARNELILAQSL